MLLGTCDLRCREPPTSTRRASASDHVHCGDPSLARTTLLACRIHLFDGSNSYGGIKTVEGISLQHV